MKALGIVIFSHMRSRISRPESGWAMALTTVAMSVLMVRFKSSKPATQTLLVLPSEWNTTVSDTCHKTYWDMVSHRLYQRPILSSKPATQTIPSEWNTTIFDTTKPIETWFIYLFIYRRLIAKSTAQGHLRDFHKFKSRTSWIQYKTCTLLHKRKTYK